MRHKNAIFCWIWKCIRRTNWTNFFDSHVNFTLLILNNPSLVASGIWSLARGEPSTVHTDTHVVFADKRWYFAAILQTTLRMRYGESEIAPNFQRININSIIRNKFRVLIRHLAWWWWSWIELMHTCSIYFEFFSSLMCASVSNVSNHTKLYCSNAYQCQPPIHKPNIVSRILFITPLFRKKSATCG